METKTLKIKNPCLIALTAKRNSGKSHMICWLLYKMAREFDHVIIMSPTSFNGFYESFIAKENIISTFDESYIDKLFNRQKKLLDDKTRKKKEKICLILDDCVSSSTFKSPTFQRIAAEGRHYLITVLITVQHYHKLPPIVRLNCDYLFILGNQTKDVQKKIFDEFSGSFDDLNAFMARLKECTQDYAAFVIDNLNNSNVGIRAPAQLPKFMIKNKQ